MSVPSPIVLSMSFTFIDLFAGIGGFHGALSALGGECVYASEIDKDAARIYNRNWGLQPDGDITIAANENTMQVPEHDVLVGGFPCQPFSKSGKQRGMDEARFTLTIPSLLQGEAPLRMTMQCIFARNIIYQKVLTYIWFRGKLFLKKFGFEIN